MHRSVVVVFVALVLLVTASAGTATVTAGVDGSALSAQEHHGTELTSTTNGDSSLEEHAVAARSVVNTNTGAQTSQEFDTTRFEITVYADGTATWTFRYERYLESASEEDEFRAFAEEFETEETDLYDRFTEQAHALTETGYEHTDREMEAEEFNRSAGIDHRPSAMGVVEMTFTWTNFAHVDDDGTVTVGDVFDPGIIVMPGQTLTVSAGDDLVFDRTSPDGRYTGSTLETSSSVSWSGDDEFL